MEDIIDIEYYFEDELPEDSKWGYVYAYDNEHMDPQIDDQILYYGLEEHHIKEAIKNKTLIGDFYILDYEK